MSDADTWLSRQPVRGTRRLRLYCFPYAGGGAQIYRGYSALVPPDIEVCAVQLPGRERRFGEPAPTSVGETVERLVPVLRAEAALPYAFFGHSLGALLAYELARALRDEGTPGPAHLFVSAHRAPHLPDPDPPIHGLPDDEFIDELTKLNGTPSEVFEHKELLDLMLPLIRADFTAAETYQYRPGAPLGCPITAFGGTEDPMVSVPEVEAWVEHTTAAFDHHILPGDHFIIHHAQAAIIEQLHRGLARLVSDLPLAGAAP